VASDTLNAVQISSPFQGVLILVFETMLWGLRFPLMQFVQRVMPAFRTAVISAVISSLEPVFAAVFG
jgi:hypothetical protein